MLVDPLGHNFAQRSTVTDEPFVLMLSFRVGVGRLTGASDVLPGAKPKVLRIVFTFVIVALGIEMIHQGLIGKL